MNSVKVNRNELLKIVQGNMMVHIAAYKESVEDYKNLVLTYAKDNLVLAETMDLDIIRKIKAPPAQPTSYEDNYKRAIRMLELSIVNEIELQEHEFNQLVLDEWSWKHTFLAGAASYKMGNKF